MGLKFSNFGKAVVASAPSGTGGLSFSVEAGKGLLYPALAVGDYFYGIFKDASGNREIVKVEARSTDAMTISVGGRGLDGTTARTWAAGDYFVAGICKISLEESLSNPILAALAGLTPSAGLVPYFSGASSMSMTAITPFSKTLLDDADAAAARATLGVSAAAVIIPVGTVMAFFQAAAPTGWTQVTTQNNKAMRVVSGAGGGVGGSVAFTTAFASQAVAGSNSATTLTDAQMPTHQHSYYIGSGTGSVMPDYSPADGNNASATAYTNYTGGSGSHNHTFTGTAINLAVQYIDMIIASKT